jgi:hypothetical protein
MKVNWVTPHAAVLIWNYVDRINADGGVAKVHATEPVIIGTSSVISISTSKSKSSPAGNFEVRLAPRFNWVTRITPGSWCAILMSQTKLPTMSNENVGVAQPNSFKMLGRIDSVRGVVEVNQETGARNTSFVVTGQDWGSVFETILYIDQGVAENVLKGDGIAQMYSVLGLNYFESFADAKDLPNPSQLVDDMISLWGLGAGTAISNGETIINETNKLIGSKLLLSTRTQYQLPEEVARFMKQGKQVGSTPISGSTAVGWNELIKRQHGVLPSFDDPKKTGFNYNKVKDSFGFPNPSQLIGQHTLWQLLNDVSNPTLYELVSDIRWDDDKPSFTLYHRVKPFINRENFLKIYASPLVGETDASAASSTIKELVSLFKNVRRIEIPLIDVVNINFGTNWRDKVNFVEVRANTQLLPEVAGLQAKLSGQTLDRKAYERDGFKPFFATSAFVPIEGNAQLAIDKLSHWKLLLREWYFNTHMMLNGAVTFIGQENYIQVGDNIMIDSAVLGDTLFNAAQGLIAGKTVYFLAHVENIAHHFAVNAETGARTFYTTVQFVRGILSDSAGNLIGIDTASVPGSGLIDRSAEPITTQEERNKNTFGTSVASDPDVEILGKNGLV